MPGNEWKNRKKGREVKVSTKTEKRSYMPVPIRVFLVIFAVSDRMDGKMTVFFRVAGLTA